HHHIPRFSGRHEVKERERKRWNCTGWGARVMTTTSSNCACPSGSLSTVTRAGLSRATRISILESGERTTVRPKRECGATGVSRIDSIEWSTRGPPAEKEYAVEPVGVATIS